MIPFNGQVRDNGSFIQVGPPLKKFAPVIIFRHKTAKRNENMLIIHLQAGGPWKDLVKACLRSVKRQNDLCRIPGNIEFVPMKAHVGGDLQSQRKIPDFHM